MERTSLKSPSSPIYDHVDKVFVFWTDRAFKNVEGAIHKGAYIPFRKPIDRAVEIVKEMCATHPKIEMIYDHWPEIDDQFRHQVNTHILPNYPRPDIIIALEYDCVFTGTAIQGNPRGVSEGYVFRQELCHWFDDSSASVALPLTIESQRIDTVV